MENSRSEKGFGTEFLLSPESAKPQVCFMRKNLTTELSSDYTLPDYLPEIRKMLGICVNLSPISRYIGNTGTEFSGRADYDIIYVGGDGNLASAPLGTDFTFEVQSQLPPHIERGALEDTCADVKADSVHCRVTAPRKINVKCRLRAVASDYGEENISAKGITTGTERLRSEANCGELHRYMSEVIELSDEIDTGLGSSEEAEIIFKDGNAYISSVTEASGKLNCQGAVICNIIYRSTAGDEICKLTSELPFTENIDIKNTDGNKSTFYTVTCNLGEIKATFSAGNILIDTEVILEAEQAKNIKTDITEDIFIPGNSCSVSYRPFNYSEIIKCENASFTVSKDASVNEISIPENSQIIHCRGECIEEELFEENQKLCINGKCRLWALAKSGEEFSSGEITVPFSFDTGLNATAGEKLILRAVPTVSRCNIKASGENLLFDIDISMPYRITSERTVNIADGINSCESMQKKNGITVYYPESGESLWSIAKKFGISLKDLSEANDLPSVEGSDLPPTGGFMLIY